MRVARIELHQIGPFEEAVFEIPPPAEGQRGELVIFEGPNGSGKTTLAHGIALAIDHFAAQGKRHLHAPWELLPRRARGLPAAHPRVYTSFEEGGDILISDQWKRISSGGTKPENLLGEYGNIAEHSDTIRWAAFTHQGHQLTPVTITKGPSEIESRPLQGALSFGASDPASAHFGQLLVNLDQEVAKAFREAHRKDISTERAEELTRLVASRQSMMDEIARALSETLDRKVTFDIPVGQHSPTVLIDGEAIPLDLLGEGMRSTFAWLSDLLVRLYRVPWEDASRSPLEQDFWLILDEIDESLHPTLQMRILPALRRLFPNACIYLTTHSPFIVASAGEGWVFPIRPDARRRVTGTVKPLPLTPGQSLEWVVEEVFGAETGFLDAFTRGELRAHRADIQKLRRKEGFSEPEKQAFLDRRNKLMGLNEDVRSVVAMQEVPVARIIESWLTGGTAAGSPLIGNRSLIFGASTSGAGSMSP